MEKKEKVAKKDPVKVVQELLFDRFKKSVGIKVFRLKYDGDEEKVIYNTALSELKSHDYLTYMVNFTGIQVFLTDKGRTILDENESWLNVA